MKNSGISWTHHTFNPWVGCDKIAPECAHCYIDREIRKQADSTDGAAKARKRKPWGEVYITKTWKDPYDWQKELKQTPGVYSRVFTCSLSDFFHAKVDSRTLPWNSRDMHRSVAWRLGVEPGRSGSRYSHGNEYKAPWRDCAWQVIRDTPNLVYLILTKRPELIEARLPKDWGDGYKNVWLGVSVGCKLTLSKMDSLRKIPVHPEAVRFVSCEPLLEDISQEINLDGYGWVICGGESGGNPEYLWNPAGDWRMEFAQPGRRTMQVPWAYNLMLTAKRSLLPFWFKQITASRSGQGEDVLGFVMQEVPDPPKDGIWIPEHADAVSEASESDKEGQMNLEPGELDAKPKPGTRLHVLDRNFVRAYAKRMPHVVGSLIGQYRGLLPKPEPPLPVGSYYAYQASPTKEDWSVCRIVKRGRGFAEETFGTYATKEEAVSHLKQLVSATSGIRNVSDKEGETDG